MNSLSLSECCHMLAVDSKTLRQWLAQAQMTLHPHPIDARIKCLSSEQVQVLASLHDQRLVLPDAALDTSARAAGRESDGPSAARAEADLRARLMQMEAQVAMLQAQLTTVALQLLQERGQRMEPRLPAVECSLPSSGGQALASLADAAPFVPEPPATPAFVCHPTEQRNRLVPLIEWGVRGHYVLICPRQGEILITPDSPEWFAWLASLSSFRFEGQAGYFSARRGYNQRPNRGWYGQRTIHQKNYGKYIGVSEHVTIDRLERIAAYYQSYMQ